MKQLSHPYGEPCRAGASFVCGFFFSFCLQYIVECHGNTLLPQFLGMYRLTVDGDETYMIVTRNVFSPRLPVHKKYDLKVRALRSVRIRL